MSYKETVHALETRPIMPDRAPSLSVTQQALSQLELPIRSDRVILVAGTNGKGSVAATLEALLRSAGQSVGLYTSPHLIDTTERIRINGKDVSREDFCEAYRALKERIEPKKETLTHFECLTLMAAWLFFKKYSLDWVVLEVGMGGTWDATNAIPHQTSVITRLGLDHEHLLGSQLIDVARNKFGIINSENQTVVHAAFSEELAPLIKEKSELSPNWVSCRPYDHSTEGQPPETVLHTPWGKTRIQLPGSRGAMNTALALTTFEAVGFDAKKHLSAVKDVRWPGRMELLRLQGVPCPIALSGDHNPQGIQSLLDLLPHYSRKHLHILFGCGRNKNLDGMISPLSQLENSTLFLTEIPFQPLPLEGYGEYLKAARFSNPDPTLVLKEMTKQATSNDLILITGSLYLVGAIRKWLLEKDRFN